MPCTLIMLHSISNGLPTSFSTRSCIIIFEHTAPRYLPRVIVARLPGNFDRNAKSVLTSRDLCYPVIANAALDGPEPAVLLLPRVERRFTDAELAADFGDRRR
jgi:hypothetical protein